MRELYGIMMHWKTLNWQRFNIARKQKELKQF